MLLIYLNADLLLAVFTAGMIQRKPCPQLHPEAPFQVDEVWLHILVHSLVV